MKEVIQYAKGMDHSPALVAIGVGRHDFKSCWVAEKSDVDAAVAGAIADCKGHADWRAKQVADTKADLTYVREQKADLTYAQELDSRVEKLRCQIEGFINAIAGRPAESAGLEKLVQQFEERINLSQRKNLNKLREEFDKLGARLKEIEAPTAATKADLAMVQEMGSRVEQLRLQMDTIIDAIAGRPTEGAGPETVVQQFEERINLSQRKNVNKVREELEKLQQEVASIGNNLKKFMTIAEKPAIRPDEMSQNPSDGQIQEIEVRLLKRIEAKLRDADEKISKLEQRTPSSDDSVRVKTQIEQLVAWRSSSFLQRLLWLLRGC
jgi:chromosome segregation ATPase